MTITAALVAVLAAALAAVAAHLWTKKQSSAANETLKSELTGVQAAAAAREQELRTTIEQTRQREIDAKVAAADSEQRYRAIVDDLSKAKEEKGRFENAATTADQINTDLQKRIDEIARLNTRINDLDREKTKAIKDAEAANNRADQTIASEREANAAVVRAKNEQIDRQEEFIKTAREVLSNEFKALSADALKNVSAHLVETADGLIKKHGEQTSKDVELHQKHIENMLLPVGETIKHLDKHVEESNVASNVVWTLQSQLGLANNGRSTMNVWRLMVTHVPERYAEVLRLSRTNGAIAIGWGGIGDIAACSPQSEQELTSIVKHDQSRWGSSPSNIVNGGKSLWRLYHEVHIGDLVIMNTNRRELVMQVTGAYFFNDDPYQQDYNHQRKASALPIDPELLWQRSGGAAPGENVRWTLFRCANAISEAELKVLL